MTVAYTNNTEQSSIASIVDLMVTYLHPRRIILFGSRASGKAKTYADFDIAVQGAKTGIRKERLLKDALDKKLGIYTVDIVNLDRASSEFKRIVMEKGKVLYER